MTALELPPSVGKLALTPDLPAVDGPLDLSALDDVAWIDLADAYGPAVDTPGLIRELAASAQDWDTTLDVLFGDNLLHQGTCFSATAPALPFVVALVVSGGLPSKRRLNLLTRLFWAASVGASGVRGDNDVAGADDRERLPATYARDVHDVVGENVQALLARWEIEPPALRYVLAGLAALYPSHGREHLIQINTMVAEYAGTQAGEFLDLAAALTSEDQDRAWERAERIVAWDVNQDPIRLEDQTIAVAVRLGEVLAEGILHGSALHG